MATQLGTFLHNLLNRSKQAIVHWRGAGRLDSQEIETVARDLNIGPAELVTLMSTSVDSSDLLHRRLAYAGLAEESLAASHPDELRDLKRVCNQCSTKARCARDLAHKRIATPSKYCPNELTMRLLVREACQERSAEVLSMVGRRS